MYVSAQLYSKVRIGGVYRKDRFCEILRIAAPAVRMREKDAGNPLLAVEERPGKFPIMIIKETGRQAYAPSRCHICQRRLMIMTREEIHAHLLDHPLLHTLMVGGGEPPPTIRVRPRRSSGRTISFPASGSSFFVMR